VRRGRWPSEAKSEGAKATTPILVEVGAGSGSLLKPLLATLETLVDPSAVEASPAARQALGAILSPDRIVPTLDDLPDHFSGIVVANELLDNLPVALAVRTGGGWTERWVGVQDDELVLVPVDARADVADWAERFGLPAPERGLVEVQLAAGEWLRSVLDRLDSGTILLIDYGDTTENLEKRRVEGTLRTYRAHHLGPHPLDEPGETDITVDVNFTALIDRAVQLGASVEYHRQDDFLSQLGLRARLSRLRHQELDLARDGDPMERLKVRSLGTEAETLLHPRGLGDFRVLVVRRH
jgi:SAM-dependent MidA family methyltransferase